MILNNSKKLYDSLIQILYRLEHLNVTEVQKLKNLLKLEFQNFERKLLFFFKNFFLSKETSINRVTMVSELPSTEVFMNLEFAAIATL